MRTTWAAKNTYGGGFVDWRPGYSLPRRWTTELDRQDLPYVVELEFAAEDGGPSCRAVRLIAREESPPISARSIREIPVAECIRVAITSAAVHTEKRPGEIVYQLGGGDPDLTAQLRMARTPDRRTSDEHLREVAEVYRRASEKPTQSVQDAYGWISYSTAARWVMQARQRGFLPRTTRGRRTAPAQED